MKSLFKLSKVASSIHREYSDPMRTSTNEFLTLNLVKINI